MNKKYYGLDEFDTSRVELKLKRQDRFLNSNMIVDSSNGNMIPLKTITYSAYHNPERYYAEIQNRVNTLVKYAKSKNLKPLFMTLTLPSIYHKAKVTKSGKLVHNHNYAGLTECEGKKELTRMLARLRHDRSLKELAGNERMFFRITEPHKDGTPHTHILLFVPEDKIDRVISAFKRLFCQDSQANDIQNITADIQNAVGYVMKYINKTLPLSKKKGLTEKEECLHYWYSLHRIARFNSSNSLAPLGVYRKTHDDLSLMALTKVYKDKELQILINDKGKMMQITDIITGAIYYQANNNAKLLSMRSNQRAKVA
jgi:Bacteriophage replication gene A protein (GPA)